MLDEECYETRLLRVFAHESATEVFLGCGPKDDLHYLHFQTTPGFWTLLESAAAGRRFNRPQTFELLCDFIKAYDVSVAAIYIHDFVKKTYVAQICLLKPGAAGESPRVVLLDARPSDAILVASVFKKKVMVKKTLFTESEANEMLMNQFSARQAEKSPFNMNPDGK
ncbi:MAG: bifunctional nuclease family protein [Opitutales bacterium]|nr:bifunctional nuclease family protein [Opitutales bacterium]